MRKVICLLIIFLMLFGVVGCDSSESDITENHKSESQIQTDNTENNRKNSLLSALNSETPFITTKNTTVYLKNYKPFYKYPDEIDYYETDILFIPKEYTFVDLDNDNEEELIITNADTYLILNVEDEKIYGYSLYNRWFQELKKDGSFQSSSGALINDYNTINFRKNTYTIDAFAKYYFIGDDLKSDYRNNIYVPDYEKSIFEINGKSVSYEKIKKFAEEWHNRTSVEWMDFNKQ